MTDRSVRVMGVAAGLACLGMLVSAAPGVVAQGVRAHPARPPRTFGATMSPVVVDERTGRVFVAINPIPARVPGTVRVFDAHSGRVLRTIALRPSPADVAVDEHTGRAFVAAGSVVRVLDATTGTPLRTVAASGYLLAVDERTGHLFVAGNAGRLSMLDARSGAILHTVAVGRQAGALVVDAQTGRAFLGTICPTDCFHGAVSVLDTDRGVVLHTLALPLGQYPIAAAVDAQTARVFLVLALVGHDNSKVDGLDILDARNGTLLRTVAVGGTPIAAAVDAQTGRVFVANNGDRTVSVLDAQSGLLLRTVPVGWSPAELAVDVRTGRVFVANFDDHTVSVLDATSGAVLHTITVGSHPSAVAVDAQTGRVFVVDPFYSGTISMLDATSGRILHVI